MTLRLGQMDLRAWWESKGKDRSPHQSSPRMRAAAVRPAAALSRDFASLLGATKASVDQVVVMPPSPPASRRRLQPDVTTPRRHRPLGPHQMADKRAYSPRNPV